MKVICILCEQPFVPTKLQVKKIRKHPHKIIICSDCYERMGKKALERRAKSGASPTTD
jgi:uncharacterized protein YlaI